MEDTNHSDDTGTESAAGFAVPASPRTRAMARAVTMNHIDDQAREVYIISKMLLDGQLGGQMLN